MSAALRAFLAGPILCAGIWLMIYVATTPGEQIGAALGGGLCIGAAMTLVAVKS